MRQKADPPILPIMTKTELADDIVKLIPDSGLRTPIELQEGNSILLSCYNF